MTAFKIIKWLTVILVTPWLIFMVTAVMKGGEPFKRMGDGVSRMVEDSAESLAAKADVVKWQADEWKEKYLGIKREEEKPAEAPLLEKKTDKKKAPKKKAEEPGKKTDSL